MLASDRDAVVTAHSHSMTPAMIILVSSPPQALMPFATHSLKATILAHQADVQAAHCSCMHIRSQQDVHPDCSIHSFGNNLTGLSVCLPAPSLSDIRHVTFQSLHASNNQVRDIVPLSGLPVLYSLGLFGNSMAALDDTIAILATLPALRDLEMAGNPLASVPDYSDCLLSTLYLKTLDGAEVQSTLRPRTADGGGGDGGFERPGTSARGGSAGSARPPSAASGSTFPPSQEPSPPASRPISAAAGASSGRPPPSPRGPGRRSPLDDLETAAHSPSRPASSIGLNSPSRPVRRDSSANDGGSGGGNGSGGPGGQQLYTSDFLNDHPILLEYLVKHVLAEGLSLTGSSIGEGVESVAEEAAVPAPQPRLKSSFVNRLRGTAAFSTSTQFLEPHELVLARTAAASSSSTVPSLKAEGG